MPSVATDLFGWLAGAFYVIIALAIVYLYFFKIAPMIINKVGAWNLGSVLQVTLVLAGFAILLGSVAIFTADWIFSQVLDTLPRTRMAREINRVTGNAVRLTTVRGERARYRSDYEGDFEISDAQPETELIGSADDFSLASVGDASLQLKSNAMELWAATIQSKYNKTGNPSDNGLVMARRDIPRTVACDVMAVADGYLPKRYEDWNLVCSNDGYKTYLTIPVNGTAARGLTGGSYHGAEAPTTVYGVGPWPQVAYEAVIQEPAPSDTPGGSNGTDAPAGQLDEGVDQVASSQSNSGIHTVRQGESLALIAAKYNVSVSSLINANINKYPRLQNNPNVIRVDWELALPK